jgi:hypothetical protein
MGGAQVSEFQWVLINIMIVGRAGDHDRWIERTWPLTENATCHRSIWFGGCARLVMAEDCCA